MLTFRAGDAARPRGHALVYFTDSDNPDTIWATYLVVAPIKMDISKYIPAAFASQFAGQLGAIGPSAYPLPPVPEKFEGGLSTLARLAELRDDDMIDGGTLRLSDPLYALQPVTDIGTQYAEMCATFFSRQLLDEPVPSAPSGSIGSSVDVDELLLQVMPDSEKIGRLARLTGTLRYGIDGGDTRLVEETVAEMERVGRHLPDKFRPNELIAAARSSEPRAAQLAELYLERCYRLVDEDYAAMAELDNRIERLRTD